MYSTVARHQDFRDANKTLKMQGVLTNTLKMQENANKTLKMWEKWRQTFEDARVCYKDFEDVKTCHQESDFKLHKPLYKATRGLHWIVQA